MSYLLGIDIGTTGTKTALFDIDGNLIADSYSESQLITSSEGSIEQDPNRFYESVCETIHGILDKSRVEAHNISAISIDGQMAGILGIDKDYNPVMNYDSWLDNRCQEYVDLIQKEMEEKVIDLSGLPTTVAHCAKILWWKHKRPEVFDKVFKFIQPAAYVSGRLAGLAGSDAYIDDTYLHFSGLADLRNSRWSEELCGHFGIPMEKLPRIVNAFDVIGAVSQKAAAETGLCAGTPIAAGCGDQAAGFLGAGFTKPGMVVDVAGTASLLACSVSEYRPDTKYKTLLFPRAVQPDLYFPHAYIGGGGLCLQWFRDNMLDKKRAMESDIYMQLDTSASKIEPGSEGLLFVPHLGGRNYPYNPKVRGTYTGFGWNHGLDHFYRAIMESIAYEYAYYLSLERSLFPETDFRQIRVIGGGAKGRTFNQIKCDVLGIPYVRLSREEVGGLGSAILAGYAVGIYKDLQDVPERFNSVGSMIYPNADNHKKYQAYAQAYLELLDSLDPVYNKLRSISRGNY